MKLGVFEIDAQILDSLGVSQNYTLNRNFFWFRP